MVFDQEQGSRGNRGRTDCRALLPLVTTIIPPPEVLSTPPEIAVWSISISAPVPEAITSPPTPLDDSGDQARETAGDNVCASAVGGWTNTATDRAPSTATAPASAKALVNEPLASTI